MGLLLSDSDVELYRLPPGLSDAQHRALGEKLHREGVRGIEASYYGPKPWPQEGVYDLDFLKHYRDIERLSISLPGVVSYDPIERFAPTLKWLGLGEAKSKKISLAFLESFAALREFGVIGNLKNFETIGKLVGLERLFLGSQSSPDLSILAGMKKLERFHLQFGSATDISPVGDLPKLKALGLMRVRGLADLSPVASIASLQYLMLEGLKQVTHLPDFGKLKKLRRVHLEIMNGLETLEGLEKAPALEDVVVIECYKMPPQAFACLKGHKKLKAVLPGIALIGSKKSMEVKAMFPGKLMDGFYATLHQIFELT